MTREEFAIVNSIANAARVASTMFEAKEDEQEYHPDKIEEIGQEVLKRVSKSQLENLWTVCNTVLA